MLSGAGIGPTGFILLIILALILFGPSKLPELGRAVGRTFREFKDGTREMIREDEKNTPSRTEAAQPVEVTTDTRPEDRR